MSTELAGLDATELLAASVLHSTVALAWIAGVRRLAGPISASLTASLGMLAIALPVVLGAARLSGLPPPPDAWLLVRVRAWVAAIEGAGPGLRLALLALLGGTGFVFAAQELLPLQRWRGRRWQYASTRDRRLEASLARVRAALDRQRPARWHLRMPRILALETPRPIAALHGMTAPIILVSRGLLDRLDDEQLDNVVAHEVAHSLRGGNLLLLIIWLARVLQAASPTALVLYRNYIEAQEQACDSLAARLTGHPAALASALLEVQQHRHPGAIRRRGEGFVRRSRREILRRTDLAVTRARVRALLDTTPTGAAPHALVWGSACVLAALLWGIA